MAGWSIKFILLTDPQDLTRLCKHVLILISITKFFVYFSHLQFNFVGRILGPRGMTAKQLEQETGCKIMVRGKGSMRDKKKVSLLTCFFFHVVIIGHLCISTHVVCSSGKLQKKNIIMKICCFTYYYYQIPRPINLSLKCK